MKNLSLKKDNSGAAMLTVVIAIMFIVLLGTALLTASYLGFAVTMTERSGQRNFYDASTAMDDIRAYVHTQSSDALARAYTDTLKNYSTNKKTAGYDVQADFSQKFVAELESNTSGFITKAANNTYQANLSALQDQLKPPTGDSAVLSAANGGPIALDSTGSDGNLTYTSLSLTGLSLTYTDSKNFQTTITTDLAIKIPAFNVASSMPYSLKDFSIVADTALVAPAIGASVTGNVFAGRVDVTSNGSITFNGDLLCGGTGKKTYYNKTLNKTFTNNGDINVAAGSLTFSGSKDLWARNISLSGSGCSFTTADTSRTYVKNDLSVTGASDTINLAGEYTGFGGDTASKGISADKDNSSAILISGKSTTMNISGLSKLTLAGVSFVNPTAGALPMGQSVAVQTDQLAYLVPVGCLNSSYPTNPYYYAGNNAPTPKVYTDTALWPNATDTTLKTKTIVDYLGQPQSAGSLSFATGSIVVREMNIDSTQHISFVFFNFTDQIAANAYFRDYCKANAQNISQYLGYYLANGTLVLPDRVTAAGETYAYNNDTPNNTPNNKLTVNDAAVVSAAGPADLYATVKGVSPYSSFALKFPTNSGHDKFYLSTGASQGNGNGNGNNGNLIGIVRNGNYQFNKGAGTDQTDDISSLRIIVVTGDVEVPAGTNFKGIIIAGGTVTISGTVSPPDDADWQELLGAKTKNGNELLSDYVGNGGTSGNTNNWDLSDFVKYSNWKKS